MSNQFQESVKRVAARHLQARSAGQQYTRAVEDALDALQDAISVSEDRSSDNPETGEALADWNTEVANANKTIREFSSRIAPILRRIR